MNDSIKVRCIRCRTPFEVERMTGDFAGTEIATCPNCNIQFPAEWPPEIPFSTNTPDDFYRRLGRKQD